jgi:galactose mutarotase-like enzyme
MAGLDGSMATHSIAGGGLRASIARRGAELVQLGGADGGEVLWQGVDPWPRHAPNLFPVVGALAGDVLRHRGAEYRVTQHGFARDLDFTWLEATATTARLELRDDAATRARYPFAFRFEIGYAMRDGALEIGFTLDNPGEEVLPASFGAHPAFRWPLLPGIAKEDHVLTFSDDEVAPIRRPSGGLLGGRHPNPVRGRALALSDALFAAGAVVMEAPASSWVRYSAPGAPAVTVSWDSGFPNLGIWSRPDAALLCIEPWHGMASPVGFDGEFTAKPGVMLIPPGERRRAVHRIAVG